MSLTSDTMTPADIAAVCGNNNRNNDGMFGNDWAWIVILLLFGWGGRGFGGFGGGYGGGASCGAPCATQADLAAGFNNSAVLANLNDLSLGQAGIQQTLCQGFNGVDRSICNLGYNVQAGFNGISREIGDCCCQTQRAIDRVAYENQSNTCALQNTIQNTTRDVIENANANSRAILDFLVKDKIDTLQNENLALRFSASQSAQNAFITANQEAQTAELIRRLNPTPTPAYVVPNPNCCYQYNAQPINNCGCGCN